MKPYHHNKYQGDELSDSFEKEILLAMQREAAEDGEDVDSDTRKTLNKPENVKWNAHLCVDKILDSSDDDTSTLKSPVVSL